MIAQREMTPDDYLRILQRRWLMVSLLAIVGLVAGYVTASVLPKKFTSQTTVLVEPPAIPRNIVDQATYEDINQRLTAMQAQIFSRSRLEPLIQQLGLYHNVINQTPMEDLVANLRDAIVVTAVQPMAQTRSQGLPGFSVSVTFGDPHLAQQICAQITTLFIQQNITLQTQRSEDTTDFIGKQLEGAKAKLDDQDSKLADFKRHYIGSLPDQEQTNLNILNGLTSQLDAATQTLQRAQQDKVFTESMLTQASYAWQSSQTGQNPDTLEQQLGLLQTQLASLQAQYTDDYPDVIKLKNDIAIMQRRIVEAEKQKSATPEKPAKTAVEPGNIQTLHGQIHQLEQTIKEKTAQQQEIQNQIKVYSGRVQSSPAIEQEYKQLTRDYQTALDFYNDLLKKREQSGMATDLQKRQEGEQFSLLDSANLPDQPSYPKKLLFVGGGFGGGLVLGLALTLLFEMRDTSLRSDRDVELVLHLPVLAMVPAIEALSGKNSKKLGGSVSAVASGGTGTGA